MIVYQNDKRISLKWVIALIIFILSMTLTWDEVEGSEIGSVNAVQIQLEESVSR